MITLPLDASECACGNQFDHDNADAALSSEEIRLKAEELYENYLAARAEQAANAVMAVQAEFARDPSNLRKSDRVASAIRESEEARAALTAQSACVAEMKKALPPPVPAPHPVHAPAAPKKKSASAKPVMAPSSARATVKSAGTVANTASAASLRARRAARKTVLATMKSTPVPTPVAARPEIILPPTQTKTPNPAFRQAQAARAEKILHKAETAIAVKAVIKDEIAVAPKIAAAPKVEPQLPPPVPVLIKSAPRLLGSDKKECPNCTASVDSKLKRCRCGYEFPISETLMPSLAMSEDERAEFAKLFSSP
ncbi:MAG: hypothetical protein HY082_01015 [Gammaproteobacteria bacterium]|nr:hypothetical protein [Gammaproteobacteria bacterium]